MNKHPLDTTRKELLEYSMKTYGSHPVAMKMSKQIAAMSDETFERFCKLVDKEIP